MVTIQLPAYYSLVITNNQEIPMSFRKIKNIITNSICNRQNTHNCIFLGYKAMMKSSDYDSFIEITSLLNDIYQCRNMNHRGSSQSQWQNNIIAKIIPLKSLYYFKFLGVLAQYIEYIKEGGDISQN